MRDIDVFKRLASLAASFDLFEEACAPLDGELGQRFCGESRDGRG